MARNIFRIPVFRLIVGITLFLPLLIFMLLFTETENVFASSECCNGKHDDSCYEEGVAKHIHTDYRGKNSSSDTNSKRGGCYNEYHAGSYECYPCRGTFSIERYERITSRYAYSCSCNTNEEYLKYGGVGINGPYKVTVTYYQNGYTEESAGHCTRCGSTAWIYHDYIAIYQCYLCGKKTTDPGPHDVERTISAYYKADCGKNLSSYYFDNGDGEEASPVCDRTVIELIPADARQICTKNSVNESINRQAVAYFKDGHYENVECSVIITDGIKTNEWQQVTLSYGEYHMDTGDSRPRKGSATATVSLYVRGTVTVILEAENNTMGNPVFDNDESKIKADTGSKVVCYGMAKAGYHVSGWRMPDGTVPDGIFKNDEAVINVPDYDIKIICLYEPNTYNVCFDADGGHFENGGDRKEKDVLFGRVYGEIENPVKDGYVFIRWKLTDKTDDTDEKAFISPEYDIVEIPENHVLTAVWSEKGPEYMYIEYDDYFENLFQPSNSGYIFLGWYMQEENDVGKGLRVDKDVPLKYEYVYDGDIITKNKNSYVIYATRKPKEYTITFKCGNNEYVSSKETLKNADGSDAVYNVIRIGNYYDSDSACKKVRYGEKLGITPVPARFDDEGIALDDSIFIGWSSDGSLEGLIYESMEVLLEHDITVYPMFVSEGEYTVTLDPNGGVMSPYFDTGPAENPFVVKIGKVYGSNLGYIPNYSGHKFTGWSLNNDGSGIIINTTTRVFTENDHTLYARWENYVTYDSNSVDIYNNPLIGDCFGTTYRNVFVNDDITMQSVRENGYYRPYYNFVGWNTKKDGSGTWYCSEKDMSGKTPVDALSKICGNDKTVTTLYAQWDSCIEIYLDLDGGEIFGNAENIIESHIGESFPEMLTVPLKEGFYFIGYYTGTDGTGVKVYDKHGSYCLEDAGLKKADNRTLLVPDNRIFIGNTRESGLPSNSYVALPEMDRLYAFWGEGTDPGGAEITNCSLILVNNDDIKEYDEEGIPIVHRGNKLTYRAILLCDNDTEEIKMFAKPEFENKNGNAVHVFSITGEKGNIKTFVEYGKDIYAIIDLAACSSANNGFKCYECSIVIPYLSYYVNDFDMDAFDKASENNTLWGNEAFFSDEDMVLNLYFSAEDEYGEVIDYDTPVSVIIK